MRRAGLRRAVLVLHIVTSVGWLGVVAASVALAGLALTADDPRSATAVYLTGPLEDYADLLARLGPHTTGKGCLYLSRLDRVDQQITQGMFHMRGSFACRSASITASCSSSVICG